MADARQITRENQHVEAMSVSHDGKWIAYDSDRGGNFDIYKMRLDGGEPMQLTSDAPNEFHPDWSPDDRTISFHSQRDGVRHIYAMSADGSSEKQVTSGTTQDFNRVWSPDGRSLSFASQTEGSREFRGTSSGRRAIEVVPANSARAAGQHRRRRGGVVPRR